MIRFDKSDRSIVTLCTCGWRVLTFSLTAAELQARSHLDRCLPAIADPADRARQLSALRQRQHARKAGRET